MSDIPKIPNIPSIAKGTAIPSGTLARYQYEELKQEYERKRQFRHDWLIASFSALSGAVFGFLTSLLFWLIER